MKQSFYRAVSISIALVLLLSMLADLPAAAQESRRTILEIDTGQIAYNMGENVEIEVILRSRMPRAVTGDLQVELQSAPLDGPTWTVVATPPARAIELPARGELVESYEFRAEEVGNSGLFRVAATLNDQTVYELFAIEGGLEVAFQAPEAVEPDEAFTITLQVANLLDVPIRNVEVDVMFPAGATPAGEHLSFDALAPGESSERQWTLEVGETGANQLMAVATSENGGSVKVVTPLSVLGAAEIIAELASVETNVGAHFVLTGTLYNVGARDVADVTAELELADGLDATDGLRLNVEAITAGEQATITWPLIANKAGKYAVKLQAEYGAPQAASAVGFVTVVDGAPGGDDDPGPESGEEEWVAEWDVEKTAFPEHGFRLEPTRVSTANPPAGRQGILYLHPISRLEPAQLRRQITLADPAPLLKMGVAGNADVAGDWLLVVRVDGDPLGEGLVIDGAEGWQDLTFDLTLYAGETVTVEVEAQANDWWYEYAFFDYIELVEPTGVDTEPAEPIENVVMARQALDSFRSNSNIEFTTRHEDGSEQVQYLTTESAFVKTGSPYGYDEYVSAFSSENEESEAYVTYDAYWVGDRVAMALDGEWQTLSRDEGGAFHPGQEYVEAYLEEIFANLENFLPEEVETVNGVDAKHYTLTGPASGDVWIALQGAYPVRAEFTIVRGDVEDVDPAGNTILVQEIVSVNTEVYDANLDFEIQWPDEAPEKAESVVPGFEAGEFPMPSGSQVESVFMGTIELTVPLGEAEVLSFYEGKLQDLGWVGLEDFGFYTWCKEEICFSMFTWDNEDGTTSVSIFEEQ